MTEESITIKNNSTGEEADFSLLKGTIGTPVVDVSSLHKSMGLFTYDPGFVSTASCKSAITYIDGENGILLYRGYPIDELAEKLIISADNLFSANSKDILVLVEFSKNKFAIVISLKDGTFFIGLLIISLKLSAVLNISSIS